MDTKAKAPVPRPKGVWIVPLCALALLALVVSSSQRDKKSTSQPPKSTATNQAQAVPKLGWNIVDYLLARRGQYRKALGDKDLPEWSLFTDEYFRDLKARRDSVIQWTRARSSKPIIAFLGQIHPSLLGNETPELQKRIDQIQARIFDDLRREAQDAQIIAIEEAGCRGDETVTSSVMIRILRESAMDLYGVQLTEDRASQLMRSLPAAAMRAVLELKTPVTCGEEWPNRMETRLIQRGPSPNPQQDLIQRDLIGALSRLRSEIILIRTLEALRSRDGSKGIIIQGDAHRLHVERLVPTEYPITLISRPAPE